MNGPQHYAEAERLLAEAKAFETSGSDAALVNAVMHTVTSGLVGAAQAHATLALAAATVDQSNVIAVVGGRDHGYSNEWLRVLGREEVSE